MRITIDARAAGQGKTTQGIYSRLRANIALQQKTLVVVPSKALQGQYKEAFPLMRVINRDGSASVYKDSIDALAFDSLVCITHQAFLNLPFKTLGGLFREWNLILDEVFIPFTTATITATGKLAGLHFDEMFEMDEIASHTTADDDTNYFGVKVKTSTGQQNLFRVSETLRQLTSEAWDFDCTRKTYESIIKGEAERVTIMGLLSKEVFSNWNSVHIAAAAFDKTLFKEWMDTKEFETETVVDFVPHANGRVRLHIAMEANINHVGKDVRQPFNFTNYTRDKNPEVMQQFADYVREHMPEDTAFIWAANNSESSNFQELLADTNDYTSNGHLASDSRISKVNHNPHGLNHLTHATGVVLGTAIRVSPTTAKWLAYQFGLKKSNGFVEKVVAYGFYQIALRTGLRNAMEFNGEIDIFVLDGVAGRAMLDYFDINQIEFLEIPVKRKTTKELSQTPRALIERARRQAKAAGTYVKKTPMTPAERKRKCLEKKKALALNPNTTK